jgi:carotenoid cleavage dioxygenase-like enzyme
MSGRAPVVSGADVGGLPVEGELPDDLEGAYVRDGVAGRVTISGGRARFDLPATQVLEPRSGRPRIDPRTGETLAFCGNDRPPFLTCSVTGPDGGAVAPRPVEGVARPSVMHDMAITDRFMVFVVAPWFCDLEGPDRSFAWDERAGTRIALVPRDGGPVRWCDDDAFWLWHIANAYDAKDPVDTAVDVVVVDYVEWGRPAGSAAEPEGTSRLTRAILDPAAGSVRREVLADLAVEFPRVDDRVLGRPHRVTAMAAATGREHPGGADGLAWHDTASGALTCWEAPALTVGEPVFAPGGSAAVPGAGWWLAVATPFGAGPSRLLVLSAAEPGAGPVGSVELPLRVPWAHHGSWRPTR